MTQKEKDEILVGMPSNMRISMSKLLDYIDSKLGNTNEVKAVKKSYKQTVDKAESDDTETGSL